MTARAFSVSLAVALAIPVPLRAAAAPRSARAILRSPAGKRVGLATFTPARGGVKVSVRVDDLPPGTHGMHLHAAARCESPDFRTAGKHFNPFGKKHGLSSPEGAHAGDMPNLVVGSDRTGRATFTARGATLGEDNGSLFGPEGTSLVVHADPDDGKTDPAGNSGARIACGVVEMR